MRAVPLLGLLAAGVIVSVGTLWAFERGAPDFSVFYEAWRLVLAGRGAEIYQATPDRFLYAPGFAWLFAPLGWLPRSLALALWCFAKAAIIGFIVREIGRRVFRGSTLSAAGMAAWGVVLLARPILIDLQYGQVNLLILGACTWAMLSHLGTDPSPSRSAASWAAAAISGLAKIFPLPMLLVPWVATGGLNRRKLWIERGAIAAALLAVLLLPLLSSSIRAQGLDGFLDLYVKWKDALISKGLPLESHNQSFLAFLHHYFGDEPIHVIALGSGGYYRFGAFALSTETISLLGLGWILISGGALVAWLLAYGVQPALSWAAILIAGLVFPSHLVWKPYLVMALPLTILVIARYHWLVAAAFFAVINLTGFDFVGPWWGARLEAAALFLWAELVMIFLVARARPRI